MHFDYDMVSPQEEVALDKSLEDAIIKNVLAPDEDSMDKRYKSLALAVLMRAWMDFLYYAYKRRGLSAPETTRPSRHEKKTDQIPGRQAYKSARAFLLHNEKDLCPWADILGYTVEEIRAVTWKWYHDYELGMKKIHTWAKNRR